MSAGMVLSLAAAVSGEAADPSHDGQAPISIRIESPLEYQVFQRRTRYQGVVSVRGTAAGADRVEYRPLGKPLKGKLSDRWRSVPVDPQTGQFFDEVPVPAGGWYRMELRAKRGRTIEAQITIDHVGMGEVFVGAGQSNCTNYGAEKQKTASGMASTFSGEAWRLADDPQTGTQDGSGGGSFWPAFGDAMFARYGVPIGVASTGYGASSVREWLPKGERMEQQPTTGAHVTPVGTGEWECTGQLFDGLMARIGQLGKEGFRTILWDQGESDAGQARSGYPADRQITGAQYDAFMRILIKAVRARAGWDVPWIVALATYHSEQDPSDPEFRAAQRALWQSDDAVQGPDVDSLRGDYRAGVHFNGRGSQAFGRLWAEAVSAWLDRVLDKK